VSKTSARASLDVGLKSRRVTYTERVLYSEPRLQQKLATLAGREVKDTVSEIVASVRVHAAGTPQSDDITVLAVRRS